MAGKRKNKPGQLTVQDKKEIIDFALGRLSSQPCSFADLGGIWDVDGDYTFHALEKHDVSKAYIVDTDFTEAATKKADNYPNLSLINDNFGNDKIPERIKGVDAVFLFDVLLHQVAPDWDEILNMYAEVVECFVVFNQQWTGPETVRLLDLGEEEYFRSVPHDREHPNYKGLFSRLDEIHPQHKRKLRDIHNIWQWGITDSDLKKKMRDLGFTMQYYKNCGRFQNLEQFENHAFVFLKKGP